MPISDGPECANIRRMVNHIIVVERPWVLQKELSNLDENSKHVVI